MTNRLKIFSLAFTLAIASIFFDACTDSDNLVFDANNTNSIAVNVYMAKSFDSTAARVKSDTIIHGDSMLFIANVLPSKSIRIRDSYWLLDNKYYASEFNIHDAIPFPGPHEIVFILITYFGDTLSDTLHLWISSPPILDNNKFIPAAQSQSIPPRDEIQFAWNAYDIDSICSLYYHFRLTNLIDEEKGEPDLIDTIISTPYFNMNRELKPLSQYRWTVQAYNEYNVPSATTISSTFATSGIGDEGAISGTLKMSNENLYTDIEFIILDARNKETKIKQSFEKTPSTGFFEIKPLQPGKYNIFARSEKAVDFVSDTVSTTVLAGQISSIDGHLFMQDLTPPTIQSTSGKDTLDFADSLSFIITDGSSENVLSDAVVYIGSRKITQYFQAGNTLTVHTIESDRSWIPQFVTVLAKDGSGNSTSKSFVLRPSVFWFETNHDTIISRQAPITLFFKDHNPNSFIPTLYKINPNGDVKGTISIRAEGRTSLEIEASGESFARNEQNVSMSIVYTNGISQTRTWKITINEPPFMSYESHCITPCESYITNSAIFKWHEAEDPENDHIWYRLNVLVGSDTITDTTQFYYRSDYIQGTQTLLRDLPEGPLYWWVEATDSYGGVSPVWETKAYAIVLPQDNIDSLEKSNNSTDTTSTAGGEDE